jgi:hypothetical protein
MINRRAIEHLVERDEFRPFKIVTTAGIGYDITDPGGLALGTTELFYYFPRSDRTIRVPYAHIAAIDEISTAKRK